MALPGPEPAADPATTVAWPAKFSCWHRATRAWVAVLEPSVVGGLAGVITTARVAWTMSCPLTLRKPAVLNWVRIAVPALSWLPGVGWPSPSWVRIALAISCPAWACGVPLRRLRPIGVSFWVSRLRAFRALEPGGTAGHWPLTGPAVLETARGRG